MIAWLNRLVDLVEESLTEDLDVARLATTLGTSEYHLRRMFSSLTGMPLSEYVRRRRMTVAAADVVNGSDDLLTIAVRHGYGSAGSAICCIDIEGANEAAFNVSGATVTIVDANTFDYVTPVFIAGTADTARVSATAHGLVTGYPVTISGSTEPLFNGVHTITRIDANTFTFSIAGLAAPSIVPGMVASIGLIFVLQNVVVPANRPELSPAALFIGVVFSGFVGVVSGLYPAIRASRLSPVEALRSD